MFGLCTLRAGRKPGHVLRLLGMMHRLHQLDDNSYNCNYDWQQLLQYVLLAEGLSGSKH